MYPTYLLANMFTYLHVPVLAASQLVFITKPLATYFLCFSRYFKRKDQANIRLTAKRLSYETFCCGVCSQCFSGVISRTAQDAERI